MTPQVFQGKDSREALEKVRQALGNDAIILSNKTVGGGITEVIATNPDDLHRWAQTHNSSAKHISTAQPSTPTETDASVRQELREMRAMLENQIATLAYQNQKADPGRMAIAKTMVNSGFSPLLARTISNYLKTGTTPAAALEWVKKGLPKHIKTVEKEMVEEGGIFALIGPTGVGKTTTTAKIAARCAMKHGPKSFALITTDTYRLAAEEQLRGFGKIFGSPVHVVNNVEDLKETIKDLVNKKLILIDTVGMSQKDQRISEQIGMLSASGTVKRVLVLNCATGGAVLEDVANVYINPKLGGIHGAILTKTDETVQLGSALDVLIRKKIPLMYVTTGQRVPEDIKTPNTQELIEQAFAQAVSSAFSVSEMELQDGGIQ